MFGEYRIKDTKDELIDYLVYDLDYKDEYFFRNQNIIYMLIDQYQNDLLETYLAIETLKPEDGEPEDDDFIESKKNSLDFLKNFMIVNYLSIDSYLTLSEDEEEYVPTKEEKVEAYNTVNEIADVMIRKGGFDYNDTETVSEMEETARKVVYPNSK